VAEAEGALHVTVDDGAVAVAPLLRALDAGGVDVASVAVTRPTLDDVFLTLTGRSLRDADAATEDPATEGVQG
jgi:ABC-2 type transport system ATP-binding protein